MAPPQARVLKFSRSDDESQYVLLNVIPNGPKPLDVKIQATEGEAEYGATFKQNTVDALMVANCPVSLAEWHDILERLFRQECGDDIHAAATVSTDPSISIVVRRSTQGITQRLGSLTLPAVPGGELNVLDWCATAVDAAAEGKRAALAETEKTRRLEDDVAALKAQLEELLRAKDEDETALLFKFRDLLNEKKVKIREQQKILAATVNAGGLQQSTESEAPGSPPQVQPAPTATRRGGRRPAPSRASKRKTPQPDDEEEETDEGEPMEVDRVKSEPEETDSGGETQETESAPSEDDDDDDDKQEEAAPEPQAQPAKKAAAQPPPKRSLPFAKVKPKPAPAPAPAGADDETDSDDEL